MFSRARESILIESQNHKYHGIWIDYKQNTFKKLVSYVDMELNSLCSLGKGLLKLFFCLLDYGEGNNVNAYGSKSVTRCRDLKDFQFRC